MSFIANLWTESAETWATKRTNTPISNKYPRINPREDLNMKKIYICFFFTWIQLSDMHRSLDISQRGWMWDGNPSKHSMIVPWYLCWSSYLVVLFDDVLCSHRVVLQIPGQVQHVLRQLLLQVVVMLQDGVQLRGRLTLIQRKTPAPRRDALINKFLLYRGSYSWSQHPVE